jgi:hypothetical protein
MALLVSTTSFNHVVSKPRTSFILNAVQRRATTLAARRLIVRIFVYKVNQLTSNHFFWLDWDSYLSLEKEIGVKQYSLLHASSSFYSCVKLILKLNGLGSSFESSADLNQLVVYSNACGFNSPINVCFFDIRIRVVFDLCKFGLNSLFQARK